MGPMDNYADRCSGAMLGRYHYEVAEKLRPLSETPGMRQPHGRAGAYSDGRSGAGVRVEAIETPLEISVLPWTAEQLEAADHPDELQGSCRTVLDIAMKRKGGGRR